MVGFYFSGRGPLLSGRSLCVLFGSPCQKVDIMVASFVSTAVFRYCYLYRKGEPILLPLLPH